MNRSENINELAKALSHAQSQFKGAIKDSANPFFKSNYADLESCWTAIREPLTKNGLSVSQLVQLEGPVPVLETMLLHTSGQFILSRSPIIVAKQNDPQAFGAALTYFRRFNLSAIVGLTQVDDDGNTAAGRHENEPKKAENEQFIKENKARIQKNSFTPTLPSPTPGPYGVCDYCGADRLLSSNKQFYYCPNFKDPVDGKSHKTVKVEKNIMPMFDEEDVP